MAILQRLKLRFGLLSLGVILLTAGAALAQETRSSILGTVADPNGSVIPGATVTITNSETNVTTRLFTNHDGYYEAPYLLPGTYTVTVSAQGFKKFIRQGIELAIDSRIHVDVKLELGAATEEVTITDSAPLLETTSGSGSATLDQGQIMDLPMSNNNVILLARVVPGIEWNEPNNYLGLHSNAGASQIIASGGVGGISFSLDGVANQAGGRRVGYMPYADTVAEVKIDTSPFDASRGRSSGGSVSLITKSGTNAYHGTLTWQHWQQRFNATPSVVNRSYWGAIREAEANGDAATAQRLLAQERQSAGRSNNWSAVIGGPVKLPRKVFGPFGYNGRNRLFFFFSYTGYKEVKSERPESVVRTVPADAHRRGDFSDLLKIDPVRYQIYDPRTARLVGGRVVRDSFPNNQVPALNPLYKFYEKLYPRPNNVPGIVTSDGRNNFVAYGSPYNWDYKAYSNRIDFQLSPNQRMFGKWSYSDFLEDRGDWTYETARYLHSNGLVRRNIGVTVDYVRVLNSATTLNFSAAWNRFIEGSKVNAVQASFSPGAVGLPSYLDERAGDYHLLPRITFSSAYSGISRNYPGFTRYSGGTLRGEMSKIVRTHSVRAGFDLRENWRSSHSPGSASGTFNFNNSYVRRCDTNTSSGTCRDVGSAASFGLEWAAFMLGVPSGITVDTNDSYYLTSRYYSGYVQDDWRVKSRLTLNLGLRYEIDTGITERFNRGLGDFDPNAELPITEAAQAAYARSPIPDVPASQFVVRGGSLYVGEDGAPRALNEGKGAWMPRFGFAYRLNDKTVVRGGYGMFYDTINVLNEDINQFGYSRQTSTVITNNNGLTFLNTNLTSPECGADPSNCRTIFADPFPLRANGTRFNEVVGNALGLMTRVGRGFDFTPRDWERPRQQRWRLGVQRQLDKNTVAEVAYVGTYTDHISLVKRLDAAPERYWASGMARNDQVASFLNGTVPNPFNIANFASLQTSDPLLYQDMASNSFFTRTTVPRSLLLRPYPHMTASNGLRNEHAPDGESKFNQLEATLRRRMSKGLDYQATYSRASHSDRTVYENEFDDKPLWRPSTGSSPHRFVLTAIYQLPFGKGKPLLAEKGLLRAVFGGWQISAIYNHQSGRAYDLGNWFFYGDDLRALKLSGAERNLDNWFNWRLLPGASRDYLPCDRPGLPADACLTYVARVKEVVPAEFWPRNSDGTPKSERLWSPSDFRPNSFHRRVIPPRLKWLRTDRMIHMDANLMRTFRLNEKTRLQFRVDLLNALNNVIWSAPNTTIDSTDFGKVNTQRNDPRFIQFQMRLTF
jgi:Carboxypeptidase regulatory-like domain/TonB dependent receptor-like, beta-barrel